MIESEVQPFDSFALVYKVLVWAGYYKLLNKPKNKFKRICHQLYRPCAILFVFVFNLQHIAFMVLRRNNVEEVFDALSLEVPVMNLFVKILALNLQIPRIDKINQLINEPIFGAKSKKDKELLLNNNTAMNRLTRYIMIAVFMSFFFWPASHYMKRYQDPNAVVPSYVPFSTDTWGKFSISVALEVSPLLWIGFGHIALDLVVSAYYAQAEVQLKIIKYNLEHMFDADDEEASNASYQYTDVADADLKKRFVYYVQRLEKLAWYTKEITEIFNPAISFQFITSSLSLCVVVYRMSVTPAGSVPFVFLIILSLVFSTQAFLYCYFGNLVQYESQSVMCSLYLSNWLSVSPKFRRLLLIAMLRWSRHLTPTVFYVVPLSLNSFVTILRSAYSLYAVLATK